MNDRLFQHVIEAVARFDTVDLLAAVAALQLSAVPSGCCAACWK
jgi:hypothetical protein